MQIKILKIIGLISVVIMIMILFFCNQMTITQDFAKTCAYQFGNIRLFSLCDGHIDFPLKNIIQDSTNFDHPYFHAAADASVAVPINIFLVDTTKEVMLFDVGLAGKFGSKTGKLMQLLEQAGYKPEQITKIFITHVHPDHISGLLDHHDDKAFKNAQIFIAQAEIDYWLASQNRSIISLLKKILALYKVHACQPGEQLSDEVRVYPSAGHTPGHIGFLYAAQDIKILIWGDIIHMPQLQFAHPAISFLDDSYHDQAIAIRKKILEQAEQEKLIIAGVHLDQPGVGRVEKDKNWTIEQPSYAWVAIHEQC